MSESPDTPNTDTPITDTPAAKRGLKVTGIGKLLLILIGVAIFMPFIGVALAVVFAFVIAGVALGFGLLAAILAIVLAVLALVLQELGVVLPWPMMVELMTAELMRVEFEVIGVNLVDAVLACGLMG
jgi:hypothetical protein